jgi:acyl-CoA reductase-like NAD-dependent aldehyde dehydrogenase
MTITLINPATEEPWHEVNESTPADVDRAAEASQKAFEAGWRDLRPDKRSAILLQLARLIREHTEELAQLECRNIGKPIADCRDEARFAARIFEFYAGAIGTFGGQTLPVGGAALDYTLRQPLGVVAAIVPWNFPLLITSWKVAPALATGNCMLVKPAELSPMTALRLEEFAREAGVPEAVLHVLPGKGREIGEAMIQHRLVRKISFTGSTEVGRRVMQLAAGEIKRVSLELGGKSPNIVFADADIEKAAKTSPMSVFANAGQDCCARSRVFVERPVYERFVKAFMAATETIRVGDPTDPEMQVGPLVSAGQRETVEGFLKTVDGTRTRFAIGGGRVGDRGYFIQPTVVLGCWPGDHIWREEVFGPVVCIRPFDDEEQMLREVNDSMYGLSGSIWTSDLNRALRVAKRVESGVLSVNSHSSVHVEAPFGGFKQSGVGRDLGVAAMEGYTEVKNVYVAE